MRYVLSILVLGGAAAVAVWLYMTRPPTRKRTPPQTIPMVETAELRPSDEPVLVEAYGTVVAARTLLVQSEVEGRVIGHDPRLVEGGLIPAGSMLVQIDPKDYDLLIVQREAGVAEAQFEVDTERGKRAVAQREWALIGKEIPTSDAGRRLALRLPHEARALAHLAAAKSLLAEAELSKTRTRLICPFNALVLEESVEMGQLITRQGRLATLVGTDEFWVQVAVPISKLGRIRFPPRPAPTTRPTTQPATQPASWSVAYRKDRAEAEEGAWGNIQLETGDGEPITRRGRVLRMLGDLDPNGRMARVLVAVRDPLGLGDNPTTRPAAPAGANPGRRGKVLLGSYVKVEINAGVLKGVYAIDRPALREGCCVWVVGKDKRLRIRPVTVRWRRRTQVLIQAEFAEGERLVTSRLRAPLPGMKVRTAEPAATSRPAERP